MVLGLSISKSLIELMGGSLHVESQIDKGSTFSFSIPIQVLDSSSISTQESPTNALPQLHGHILIVEDDKTNQVLLSMLLDKVAMTYDIASDGLDALKYYKDGSYDVIFMDENMPNMNGIEAMQTIKAKHQNPPPIIAITANVIKGDEKRLFQAGMDGFIPKPINEHELFEIIESHLSVD